MMLRRDEGPAGPGSGGAAGPGGGGAGGPGPRRRRPATTGQRAGSVRGPAPYRSRFVYYNPDFLDVSGGAAWVRRPWARSIYACAAAKWRHCAPGLEMGRSGRSQPLRLTRPAGTWK